jgi:flagellar hook protein FlgE
MNVIGNNIANINTYGFKSSRVTFTDVFYQTLSNASTSSTESGGTNPTQLGYGSQVNSIDVINTRAGSTTTDRALDVYINGDGYLAVQGSDGAVKYTRVGILSFDSSGNLCDSSGNIVLGLSINETTGQPELGADGTTTTNNLTKISVDPDVYATYSDIAISEDGAITATQDGDPEITLSSGTGWITTANLPTDSNYTGEISMTQTTTATGFSTPTGATFGSGTGSATAIPTAAITYSSTANIMGDVTLTYNSSTGYTLSYTDTSGTDQSVTVSPTTFAASDPVVFAVDAVGSGSTTTNVTIAKSLFTAWAPNSGNSTVLGTAAATAKTIDISTFNKSGAAVTKSAAWSTGNTSVILGDISLTVDPTKLAALDDMTAKTIGSAGAGDGTTVTIGYIAVVSFANADGLSQDGTGYYVETTNSGEAIATTAGNSGTGTLLSGSLESSNVDLSQELTEMIITQRGFQANSKMITVSDEMLDTLVNMKR